MAGPLDNNQFKSFFHQNKNAQYRKCLWHTEDCTEAPIRAHAVQNSGALDQIAEDGHVMMVGAEIKEEGIHLKFDKIGRNKATTFTGLCSTHDTELFRPIDLNPIDQSNSEHLFLIAYRSVLKEFHSNLQSASKVQSIFLKGVELGEFVEDGMEMMNATMQLASAFQFYTTVQAYRSIFTSKDWDALKHVTLSIKTPYPPLAATGVFLPIEVEDEFDPDSPSLLVFNIIPQADELLLFFTWHTENDAAMHAAIDPIAEATDDHQLYLLSKFILKYTETFVLRPSTYASFSEDQIFAMQKYFAANALHERDEWNDKQLFLFGPVS